VTRTIIRVTDPLLLPIRRLVPPLGGLDVTPIAALLLIEVARNLVIRVLVAALSGG
jgi:YggT family protein